jgi:hypothetical protein
LSPPEKTPAEKSVPDVLLFVATAEAPRTMNEPLTVPPVVAMMNESAAESAFAPAEAAAQAQVARALLAGVDQSG